VSGIQIRSGGGRAAATRTSAPARCLGEGSADKDRDGRASFGETGGRRDSSDTTSATSLGLTSQREAAAPPFCKAEPLPPISVGGVPGGHQRRPPDTLVLTTRFFVLESVVRPRFRRACAHLEWGCREDLVRSPLCIPSGAAIGLTGTNPLYGCDRGVPCARRVHPIRASRPSTGPESGLTQAR
jgi:hypothetical protein